MPSSTENLRKKFMSGQDDGIAKAEDICRAKGCTVKHGVIVIPPSIDPQDMKDQDLFDAVVFLCQEWDYDYAPKP